MKRNVIALALCTVLAISVVGCSSNNTENKNIASDNSKIAIEDKANTFLICILSIFTFPTPAINRQINIPILIISSVEKK